MDSSNKFTLTPLTCIQYFGWVTEKDWKSTVGERHFVILQMESQNQLIGKAIIASALINLATKQSFANLNPYIVEHFSEEESDNLISILLKAKSALDMLNYFKQNKIQKFIDDLCNQLFTGIIDPISSAKIFTESMANSRVVIYNDNTTLQEFGAGSDFEAEIACVNGKVGVALKNTVSAQTYLNMYMPENYTSFFGTIERAKEVIAKINPNFALGTVMDVPISYSALREVITNYYKQDTYSARSLYEKLCAKYKINGYEGYERLNKQFPGVILDIEMQMINELYGK